jgi:hypothetical protein
MMLPMRAPRDYEWLTFALGLGLSVLWSLVSYILVIVQPASDNSPIRIVLLLPAYAFYTGGTAIGSNGPMLLWVAFLAAIVLVPALLVTALVLNLSRR